MHGSCPGPACNRRLFVQPARSIYPPTSRPYLPAGHFSVGHWVFTGRKQPHNAQCSSSRKSHPEQCCSRSARTGSETRRFGLPNRSRHPDHQKRGESDLTSSGRYLRHSAARYRGPILTSTSVLAGLRFSCFFNTTHLTIYAIGHNPFRVAFANRHQSIIMYPAPEYLRHRAPSRRSTIDPRLRLPGPIHDQTPDASRIHFGRHARPEDPAAGVPALSSGNSARPRRH